MEEKRVIDQKIVLQEEYKIFDFFPKIKNLITMIDETEYENYNNKFKSLMDEEICFAKLDTNPVVLKGYMMIKYYLLNEEWRKWILNIFKPSKIDLSIINSPSIGIHIRVGDYLNHQKKNTYFPLYTADYYLDIIKKYPNIALGMG